MIPAPRTLYIPAGGDWQLVIEWERAERFLYLEHAQSETRIPPGKSQVRAWYSIADADEHTRIESERLLRVVDWSPAVIARADAALRMAFHTGRMP